MARIAGVNIPTAKRVPIALTYITGIGPASAKAICEAVEMPYEMRHDRMVRMRSVVEENNIYMWAARLFVDLMQGARDAVSGMIDLLSTQQGISAVEAYMLCSVCADLRISEIVDQPNWVVSMYFPKIVFD